MWKVLICDDEAMTRRGLTRMIGHCRQDMEVVGAAAQGEEACAMIEQLRPSIVFMDINMPLVSGLEVIERYHEDPRLRFVIISGYSDFEYAQKACRYHVVDYLLKPVTEEQLSAVLDRCAAMLQQEITTSRIVVPQHQDRRMITQVLQEIDRRATDSEFSLNQLSEQFHVSASYLSRIIKEEVNCTFSELINEKRLTKARTMLLIPEPYLMWEIAEQCGFTSQHYFCRVFKNRFGLSPQQCRQMMKEEKQTSEDSRHE